MGQMKKFITAAVVIATTLSTVAPAFADYRRHGGYYIPPPRHYYEPVRPRRSNPAPWIAGAIGLGILGAIIVDQYGRRCYNEIVGYDEDGEMMIRRICKF